MHHRPRKRFGQHFLHDEKAINDIVAAIAPQPGDTMVEIGPGQGAITGPLLRRLGRLHAIEPDRDLLPALVRRFAHDGHLIIHAADALRFDIGTLSPGRLRVVGNLPYNISTPLIFHLLASASAVADMHFLLQKEVVDRIAAAPGSGAYGRLSVMVQYRCHCEKLFGVASAAFSPPPKVESALLRIEPYSRPPTAVHNEQRFARIVAQAFSQRRKTIKNNLKKMLTVKAIEGAGVDPDLRPEKLGLAQFAALANAEV
ncbi:MAG: 16S rRNA (adenine(1518)-N(6)/adenine(1519)-N(6))-dimethyltransferase RsmA [Gammaproteobacteria bacterium]